MPEDAGQAEGKDGGRTVALVAHIRVDFLAPDSIRERIIRAQSTRISRMASSTHQKSFFSIPKSVFPSLVTSPL
jgi:hypothetical protein